MTQYEKYLETFCIELQNRNYSRNSMKAYGSALRNFFRYSVLFPGIDPVERIRQFLYEMRHTEETKRIAYSAVKLFYELVLKKPCPYILSGVRKRKRLPQIYTNREILQILDGIRNTKHRTMIAMIYAAGLRVSEVTKIKIKDIDTENLTLSIRESKGKKDRITIFSEKLLPELQALILSRGGNEYLFVTRDNKPYSIRTVQKIFEDAVEKSGIKRTTSCHSLRHSFATHLLQDGVNVTVIKKLMGHKSVKTTMIYTHLAERYTDDIRSPL